MRRQADGAALRKLFNALRAVRSELGKTKRLGQCSHFVVTLDVLRVHEVGVGVEAYEVHIAVAGVVLGRVLTVIRPIDPEQVV